MKIKTFKDLKDALNECDDAQLSQQDAILHLVDVGAETIASIVITPEDEYLTDEGFAPISTFEPDDDDDKLENYEIRPAGYIYLLNE